MYSAAQMLALNSQKISKAHLIDNKLLIQDAVGVKLHDLGLNEIIFSALFGDKIDNDSVIKTHGVFTTKFQSSVCLVDLNGRIIHEMFSQQPFQFFPDSRFYTYTNQGFKYLFHLDHNEGDSLARDYVGDGDIVTDSKITPMMKEYQPKGGPKWQPVTDPDHVVFFKNFARARKIYPRVQYSHRYVMNLAKNGILNIVELGPVKDEMINEVTEMLNSGDFSDRSLSFLQEQQKLIQFVNYMEIEWGKDKKFKELKEVHDKGIKERFDELQRLFADIKIKKQ